MSNRIFILLISTILLTQAGCVSQQNQPKVDWEGSPETSRYDNAFIKSIRVRWEKLVEKILDHLYSTGKVAVQFRLHHDGRVTDFVFLERVSKELDEVCEKAILDRSPYPAWPKKMREELSELSREVRFTFSFHPRLLDGKPEPDVIAPLKALDLWSAPAERKVRSKSQ